MKNALVLAGVLAAFALPAAAAKFTVTYTGTIDAASDGFGLFSDEGSLLEGQGFTAVLTYDDSLTALKSQSATKGIAYGGAFAGNPSIGSGVLTIGGTSVSVGGDNASTVRHFKNLPPDGFGTPPFLIKHELNDFLGYSLVFELSSQIVDFVNTDYAAAQDFELTPDVLGAGRFVRSGADDTDLHFAVSRLSIAPVQDSPAPEPATWAMMLLGFAGVGSIARRRSRPLAA
ncbi:MAG: PEPxxWA-CTERM sorting domain-containing protein [Alphaproteobacteria bacterium]|nr:PEPxxWA-CTERM sorting domain-containing protein [Alphaproteobacteria bacterium]MBU1515607.1 PEPxxWA-CTERM sorting domain-containing protein [Alphaproteobacteria bacterium]MBU2096942.1 PEPxxWA-CTERM sorting domain-containing protein [Alphaproteobacteria bacterium]MBU2149597.1 PEPxxWA-CTERM sorting domain-containing protein [Alphaproteobacteria bacterium]MBU2305667.1 PEPxxWA-CTERM sorting domain-containing protein [Alphaproteobacteria bacterium]